MSEKGSTAIRTQSKVVNSRPPTIHQTKTTTEYMGVSMHKKGGDWSAREETEQRTTYGVDEETRGDRLERGRNYRKDD